MNNSENKPGFNRRDVLKTLGVGTTAGLGTDIDEKEAAKYPINNRAGNWTVRKRDGTMYKAVII